MRVVFDTNVVISGILWGGPPLEALNAIRDDLAILLSSDPILSELKDVLSRKKFTKQITTAGWTVEGLISRYEALVEMVEPADIGHVVMADPKDDKFLACAVGGKAIYVVSGDHHLLEMGVFQEVEIITVHAFLERVKPSK